MTTLQVLAVDPGPTWMGWARLRVEHGPGVRTTYERGGVLPCDLASYLSLLSHELDAVVVETPKGYAFQPGRVPQLLETRGRAGGMVWVAELRGMRVVEPSAQQVRKVLAGKANADDQLVRDVVRSNVFGAVGVTNEHVNDAIAAGLLGAWVLVGNAVLPDGAEPKKTRRAKRATS